MRSARPAQLAATAWPMLTFTPVDPEVRPPACIAYHPGWVSEPGPVWAQLLTQIPWEQHDITLFGRTVPTPRLTCWMGEAVYRYSGVRNEPRPMPSLVAELGTALSEQTGTEFNSCLANLYRDGTDSMGYHADDEPELGPNPTIASVSLGARRTFAVRHRQSRRRWTWDLGEGDLLIMRDESQIDYQHGVPKTTHAVGPRMNLTFRRFLPSSQ